MLRRLGVLAVVVVLASVLGAVPVAAQDAAGASDVEVRIVARKLADGRIEFGLQQRASNNSWGNRQLPRVRFFPTTATVGRWLASSALDLPAGAVRIVARKLEGGRVEFGFQERQADNSWGERRLPRVRFFPPTATVGRWLASSLLTLTTPRTGQGPTAVTLTAGGDASGAQWPGCSSEHCRHLTISLQGAPAGIYDIECWSSRDNTPWYTGRWRWPSSGLWTEGGCWFGYPGEQVWVIVDGTKSNVITWGQADTTSQPGTEPQTAGPYTAVDAGGVFHTCGLRTDATITCWGWNDYGQADAPAGRFSAVAVGLDHSCGLRTDGTITCWGDNGFNQTSAPGGQFTAVAASHLYSCGLRTDATIVCWGGWYGQADPPVGRFSAITAGNGAGKSHSCGLRTDGTITCWGDNDYGQADAPAGRFSAVTAGNGYSCGLRTDGTITCWPNSGSRNTNAPTGRFSAVTAGSAHSCGLRTNGTITCWGRNDDGQAEPPDGRYSAVTAGARHSCGLRIDGTIACWGDNEYGQLDVPAEAGDSGSPVDPVSVPGRVGRPVVVAGDGQLEVSWSAPDDGGSPLLVYEVFARERGGDRRWHRETSAASPATVTGLTNGVTYDVSVRAVNAVGGGELSPTIPGTPVRGVSVPGRVGRPVVVAGDGQLEVSWSPPDDGGSAVTNYALWYRPRGGTQWVRHSSRATSPHTIGGLTNGVTYDVAVRAGNSEGWGPWSASASGTPVLSAGDGEVEVRVAFRRLGDGRIELGLQQRLGNGTWGEIQLPRARRLPAGSPVGDWQVTSPLVLSVGEVRVVARRVEVGVRFEVEYALQQRLADKSWGMRRLPRDRVFHNNVDVWRFASPVPLKKPGVGEAPVVVVAGQGTAVTAGDRHSCGLGSDGTIGCWGDNSSGQTDAPDGRFGAVSAGFLHTCGLRTGGAIECWGENSEGEAEPPDGRFSAVSTRGRTSCGLRTNGTIACWGNNSAGQTDAPAGRFSAASAGRSHACGLRTDGTITCWGHIASEYGDAPDGRFGAVAAGGTHSCGLRTNGTIECWGGNDHGQADAPDGHFAAVAAGTWHSCGLRSDGTIACWGANNRGRKAPGGQFVAITAGHYHSCALRGDGTIACWGADRFGKSWGQIDVPAELAGDYPQIAPIGVPTVTLKPEGRSLLTSYIDDPDAVLLWDPVTGAAGYDIDWRYMTIDSRRLRQIFRDLSSSRADVDALTDEAAQLIDGYEEDPRSIRGDSRLDSGGGIEARCRIAASSGECFNFVTGRIDGFDVDDPSYRIHSAQEDKVLQVRVRAIGSSGTTGSWSTWAFHPSSRLNAGCRAVDAYNEIRDIKTAIDVANAVLTVGSLIAAIVTAGGSTVATQGGRIIALEVLKQAAKALIKNVTMKRFLLNLAKNLSIKTVEKPVLILAGFAFGCIRHGAGLEPEQLRDLGKEIFLELDDKLLASLDVDRVIQNWARVIFW